MDAAECQKRRLEFRAFNVLEGFEEYPLKSDRLTMLSPLGFYLCSYLKTKAPLSLKWIKVGIEQMQKLAEEHDLPIDGIVFTFNDVGQLGGYVVACNHILRKEGRDNPTIGLLICKEKDRIQAQYALESSSQPIGISEYDLERFYPEKIEGTMPTIEELESSLGAE